MGKDPESAYNIIMEQDNVDKYQLSRVMEMWGRQDANAAMAKIETMEIGQNRTYAISGIIGGIAKENPNKAAEMAMSLTNLKERSESMDDVMRTWINQDINGAINFLEKMEGGKNKNDIVRASAYYISKENPSKAADLAMSITNPAVRRRSMEGIIGNWIDQDIDNAINFLVTVEESKTKNDFAKMSIRSIAKKSPNKAVDLAMSITDLAVRRRSMNDVISIWIDQDIDGAINFLANMEEGKNKNDIARASIFSLSRKDPNKALEFVNKNMTGKSRDDATSSVLLTLAINDPEKVAATLEGLPYGRVYERSVANPGTHLG